MLRSLFTAVTGVRAHQTMLDVTGNNISNANTTGFKKDNTIFADLMYQANKYASGSGDSRGGINPAQVGLGVSVSAIETIHTQGSGQFTGNNSDMMIQGTGFFVYREGTQELYSRSGACVLDNNNDMVMSGTGYRLQGYQMELQPATGEYQQASELSTVNIPLGQKIDAKATTQVDYQCNLDSRSKAYLPYGFADIPYNANAGWKGNSNGTAIVPMNGTDYEMSFSTTGVKAATVTRNNDSTGAANGDDINYLDIQIQNGGEISTLKFDIVNIDEASGLPVLNLPKIKYDANASTYYTTATAALNDKIQLMGWLDMSNLGNAQAAFVSDIGGALVDGNGAALAGITQEALDKNYKPVYKYPGQTPPKYFVADYNDSTGTMNIRNVTLLDGSGNEINSDGSAGNTGLMGDVDGSNPAWGGTSPVVTIRATETAFTYNVKDNMNYTSFKLEGSPTITNQADPSGVMATPLEYNVIVEFDESAEATGSDLSKRSSKVTLWYYGYSNADDAGTSYAVTPPTATEQMHRLTATVFFNPDGTFDSVVWDDTNNMNAPLGFRIVDGLGAGGISAGPNFQIAVGTASAASSATDTLNFKQAQNLDNPGALDNAGVWTTQGTTYQGGFHSTKCTIYDDNGKQHTLEVTFKKLTENRWRWEAFLVERNEQTGEDELVNIIPDPRSGEIEFDGSGRIDSAIADSNDSQRRGEGTERFPNAEVEITLPFSLNGQPNSTVTLNFGGGVGKGGQNIDGITQFASETTTKPVYQDGYTMGVLKNYSIAVDGTVTGSYDNGVNIPLYRVALATFANEQGLEKVGNTMFQATVNSGNANIDGATVNGKGSIMSQYLEMSNVDLTEEFTHLIIAQRGFQANTRVVTVSDQILEEVVNLKR